MELGHFASMARIEAEVVHAWIEAGWLLPRHEGAAPHFSDIDLARAHLIRDLKHGLGVNDEGIPVILDLVDQVHGLRRLLRELLSTIDAQPQSRRRRMIDDMQEAAGVRGSARAGTPGHGADDGQLP